MPLQIRFILFGALYLLGFLGLTLLLHATGRGEYEPILVISWFLLFAAGQFFVFRFRIAIVQPCSGHTASIARSLARIALIAEKIIEHATPNA
jgi:hypothetical protein